MTKKREKLEEVRKANLETFIKEQNKKLANARKKKNQNYTSVLEKRQIVLDRQRDYVLRNTDIDFASTLKKSNAR